MVSNRLLPAKETSVGAETRASLSERLVLRGLIWRSGYDRPAIPGYFPIANSACLHGSLTLRFHQAGQGTSLTCSPNQPVGRGKTSLIEGRLPLAHYGREAFIPLIVLTLLFQPLLNYWPEKAFGKGQKGTEQISTAPAEA